LSLDHLPPIISARCHFPDAEAAWQDAESDAAPMTDRRSDTRGDKSPAVAAAVLAEPGSWFILKKLTVFAREFGHCVGPSSLVVAGVLIFLAGATEGVGLALLVPLIDLLGDATSQTNRIGTAARQILVGFGVLPSLSGLLVIFVGLIVLRAVVLTLRDITLTRLRLDFVDGLRRSMYRAVAGAGWLFLMRQRLSDFLEMLTSHIDHIGQGTYFLLQLPALLFLSAIQVAIAFSLSPLLTLGVLGWGGLAVVVFRRRFANQYDESKRLVAGRRLTFAEISDFLHALKIAKSHSAESRHVEAFEAALERQSEQGFAFEKGLANTRAAIQIVAAVTLGAFVYVAATFGHISPAALVVMVVIFARLAPIMSQFQQSWQMISHMLPVFDQVIELRGQCAAAAEPMAAVAGRLELRHELQFNNINFRYDSDGGPATLEAIDVTIPAGSTTAIVGHTGAGKSTFADLLLGLMSPETGHILIDGVPLTGPLLANWRRSVGYVPQDNFLFNDTVRANLLWACPEASDEDLRRPLSISASDGFIAALPQGLDTIIGERGVRLSGGERQRLGLARALLRNPTVLVLDEATSALDNQTERAVQSAIERLHGSMTIIIIAHRLSTIRGADRILVLERGRIVQVGTWDTLANDRRGAFAALLGESGLDRASCDRKMTRTTDRSLHEPALTTSKGSH
jgi:ATP-binding cassette, subfamily C, bacterial